MATLYRIKKSPLTFEQTSTGLQLSQAPAADAPVTEIDPAELSGLAQRYGLPDVTAGPASTYVVKAGDNLSTIAKRFGVDANSITGYKSGNPNLIYPNETLTLGSGVSPDAIKNLLTEYLNTNAKTGDHGAFADSLAALDANGNGVPDTLETKASALDTQRTGLVDTLKTDMTKAATRSTRLGEEENKLGVSEDVGKLKELNMQIAQATAEYENKKKGVRDRQAPMYQISGELNQIDYNKAIDIGVLNIQRAALQGNIELSRNLAKRVVDLEFDPIQQEIDNTTKFLEINRDDLNRANKGVADALDEANNRRKELLTALKEEKKNNTDLMVEVAKAGGDPRIVDYNKSYLENLTSAAPYIAKSQNGLTKTEQAQETYDQVKLEAAPLFEKDRMKNGDKKISPNLYLDVRSKVPVQYRDDFDRNFSDLLSTDSKRRFGIKAEDTAGTPPPPDYVKTANDYKSSGWTRQQIEDQYTQAKKTIPDDFKNALDQVYGRKKFLGIF